MDMSEMNEFFTPFAHARSDMFSEETEKIWLELANHYEEEGDAYHAEECRAHARKIAKKRAEEATDAAKEVTQVKPGEDAVGSKAGTSGEATKAEGKNPYKFKYP